MHGPSYLSTLFTPSEDDNNQLSKQIQFKKAKHQADMINFLIID